MLKVVSGQAPDSCRENLGNYRLNELTSSREVCAAVARRLVDVEVATNFDHDGAHLSVFLVVLHRRQGTSERMVQPYGESEFSKIGE